MFRLNSLDGQSWEEVWNAPRALILLGKTDCPACHAWSAELDEKLADASVCADVVFGKLTLDQPGLGSFKKAHPEILAAASDLPFNLLLIDGQVVKQWFGGGWERFENRLRRAMEVV